MEIPKELSAENISFSKEKSILNDIAQETKDAPGYGSLSEEELMEKVESILLEKIKAGEKQAYFQLGLFYYEQVVINIQCICSIKWKSIFWHNIMWKAKTFQSFSHTVLSSVVFLTLIVNNCSSQHFILFYFFFIYFHRKVLTFHVFVC